MLYGMSKMKIFKAFFLTVLGAVALSGCIKNDVPYPTVYGNVVKFEVEGESKKADIDTVKRTVVVYLEDDIDIRKVQVKACEITNWNIPELEVSMNPHIQPGDQLDLSSPNTFLIHTFQDYHWTISAEQPIERKFTVENQIGTEKINVESKTVLIEVPESQSLSQIKVLEAQLGPSISTMSPDPLTVTDFTYTQKFTVSYFDIAEEWQVRVAHTSEVVTTKPADAWATRAYLHGSGQAGQTFGFKIKKKGATDWTQVDPGSITIAGGEFTAMYLGLKPSTEYVYVAISGADEGEEVAFTTEEATLLPNGSFDNWHQNGKVWNPWADGATRFWDTGNRGATTVGESNVQPSNDLPPGITSGKSARLESKWIVLKFAAGNMFVGEYIETDGTNGVLNFGQPFTSRPLKLKGKYRYDSKPMNRVSTSNPDLSYMKNRPDTCHIYVALTDADQPIEIRTKPSSRKVFNPDGADIIAYAALLDGEGTGGQFKNFELELDYRATNRVPKYLILTCSASKYGDYFTGGEGSLLMLDEFELVYE